MITIHPKIGKTRCVLPFGRQALASLLMCAAGFFIGGLKMQNQKTFFLVYEIPAENITQAKAMAVDLYERNGVSPAGVFEKTEFNLPMFVSDIKASAAKG